MCFCRSFIVLCLMFKLLSHFEFIYVSGVRGEGNGNALQYSCLENPRDRGSWWAAIYEVTQRWTQLKQFSSSSSWCEGLFWFPCFIGSCPIFPAPHAEETVFFKTIVYSCLLCQRLIDHQYVGLFLDSLFCSVDPYVCFCANTMLFWLL